MPGPVGLAELIHSKLQLILSSWSPKAYFRKWTLDAGSGEFYKFTPEHFFPGTESLL